MAYDENLALGARQEMQHLPGFSEKKMFGGVGFLLWGNRACGVNGDDLIVRVGLERYQAALDKPGADLFTPTGKPMAGWITVAPDGHQTDEDLKYWIELALEFVKTLPAKQKI